MPKKHTIRTRPSGTPLPESSVAKPEQNTQYPNNSLNTSECGLSSKLHEYHKHFQRRLSIAIPKKSHKDYQVGGT